jgi:hypothetical protein
MPRKIPLNFRGKAAAWAEFARRHAGNPFLKLDPLYALPLKLIEAIKRKARGFFEPEEESFERELARLDRGDPKRRPIRARGRLRDLLGEKKRKALEARIQGYTGWLVTSALFRAERDDLRRDWGEQVEAWGRFPASGWTDQQWRERLAGVDGPIKTFRDFYNRWGLERFETWDLPRPLGPEYYGLTGQDASTLSEAGVTVFLPWHLTRDRALTLQDLTGPLKRARDLRHLRGWVDKGKGDLGYRRYRRLYLLYRYEYLALVARYGEDLGRKKGALDRAFAWYSEPHGDSKTGAENFKRARLELNKMLGPPR